MPTFRVHFGHDSYLDIDAVTAQKAREGAIRARPDEAVSKTKLLDPKATKAKLTGNYNG